VSIVPDSIYSEVAELLRSDGKGSENILMNKVCPCPLTFRIIDEHSIFVEFYYMAMRDNYVNRAIEKYVSDTIFIAFKQYVTEDSPGSKIVYFRSRLYISLDDADRLKAVMFLR
jgi:hypothetical protein